MVVGKMSPDFVCNSVMLNDVPLDFVSEYRYLGVDLVAGKALSFSVVGRLRAFHRASNYSLQSYKA